MARILLIILHSLHFLFLSCLLIIRSCIKYIDDFIPLYYTVSEVYSVYAHSYNAYYIYIYDNVYGVVHIFAHFQKITAGPTTDVLMCSGAQKELLIIHTFKV